MNAVNVECGDVVASYSGLETASWCHIAMIFDLGKTDIQSSTTSQH
jgi:hypothetical protein